MKNLLTTIDELLWPLALVALVVLVSCHFVPFFVGLMIF
jgi:hypothetical protein